ncbi:MAG: glycosyltransferase family 4 protein [Myxococcota bacterium]
MHIVLIHQYFLGPGQGGASRFNTMVDVWRAEGCDVTVVAGQVHYASGARTGSARSFEERTPGGARVLRVFTPDTWRASMAGRALSFVGFAASASAALLTLSGVDVVVATSPSLLAWVPGVLATWARGWPLVVDVRDLWPESAVSMGVLKERSAVTRALYALEAWSYASAERIVTVTPAMRLDIIGRGLARRADVEVITNGAEPRMLEVPGASELASVRRRHGWGDRFVVLYAGAHGLANGLDQWIDAAEHTRGDERILWVAIGDGPERPRLIARSERMALTNVQWLPAVSRDEIPAYIHAADAGAVVLRDVPTFRTVYPNKLFDTMAAGKPVVCAVAGAAAELVSVSGSGFDGR